MTFLSVLSKKKINIYAEALGRVREKGWGGEKTSEKRQSKERLSQKEQASAGVHLPVTGEGEGGSLGLRVLSREPQRRGDRAAWGSARTRGRTAGHRHTAARSCVTTSVPVGSRGHSGVRRMEARPHLDHTRSQGRGEADAGRGDAGRRGAGGADAGRADAGRARGCRLRVHGCSLRGVSALCLEAGSAPTARVVLFSRPRPAPQQVGKQRRCGPRRSLPGRLDLVTWGRGRAARSERSSCHGEGNRHPTPHATALRPATACPRVSGTQAIRTLSINPLLSWPDLDFYPPNDSPKAHLLCCHDARLAGRGRSVLGSSRAVKPAWDKGWVIPNRPERR
nr:uncharacterized protein LOC115866218 isoform X2 [Globicephala melas]